MLCCPPTAWLRAVVAADESARMEARPCLGFDRDGNSVQRQWFLIGLVVLFVGLSVQYG